MFYYVLIAQGKEKNRNTYLSGETENKYCFITDTETSHSAHSRHMQAA